MLRYLPALSVLALNCLIVSADNKAVSKISIDPSVESASRVSTNIQKIQQALLPREQEIELALKAAPVHLRNDATVYMFGKNGYEKVRQRL